MMEGIEMAMSDSSNSPLPQLSMSQPKHIKKHSWWRLVDYLYKKEIWYVLDR